MITYESKGSSLLLISFFTALARCVEIILKPVIAHWSDNSTFKIGRRKPFMLFGCGFYALFLVLLFATPSGISPVAAALWFGAFYVFFFIADTVVNIPYQALGPELSPDSKEREKLYVIFYICQYVGLLFVSLFPIMVQKFFKPCDCSPCDAVTIPLDKANCITQCQAQCSSQNSEESLLYMCAFVGLFFVTTIVILCNGINEKKDSFNNNEEDNYIIPTLFRMINNKPFLGLLCAWIIDATILQIFATMLPFFINMVLYPQKYCIKNNIEITSELCQANTWVGITIFFFIVFSIASMIVWHFTLRYVSKKKAWQSYSLMSILTFSLMLLCEEGSMVPMVFYAIINSIPAGGAYLNDVFVSDIIDYDEFKTGKRNEGIYIVFSTFTPKVVGIFAQSIPLTIMSCNINI